MISEKILSRAKLFGLLAYAMGPLLAHVRIEPRAPTPKANRKTDFNGIAFGTQREIDAASIRFASLNR